MPTLTGRLPATLTLGPVRLRVASRARTGAWLEQVLGLRAPIRGNRAQDIAQAALAIARQGLKSRAKADNAGQDETHFLTELDDIAASGIYEVQLRATQGNVERREFAFNVPTGEGDLALVPRDDLARQLAGVKYQLHEASDMAVDEQQLAGFQMSDALLVVLIAVLLAEQLLAYVASYHIQPVRGSSG